jgi:hypothetical protein
MKTTQNNKDPRYFLEQVDDLQKRKDAFELVELMSEITEAPPKMWGDSIIGFGTYHYKYASGREGDFFVSGFSPRKTSLTLYIMAGFSMYPEILSKLGKFKHGKSCLYIKKLDDIDRNVLRDLIIESVSHMRLKFPSSPQPKA